MENKVLKFDGIGHTIKSSDRKANMFYKEYSVIGKNPDKESAKKYPYRQFIVCRLYGNSRIYCCLWVNLDCCLWVNLDGAFSTGGSGFASGYGYHKESAAVGAAIEAAGFTLERSIDGVGDSAIEAALLAIAAFCGLKEVQVFTANG